MKKSKIVKLVLITAVLASCGNKKEREAGEKKVFMRGDSTAQYQRAYQPHHESGNTGTHIMWFYAFRPYGYYSDHGYVNTGRYSGAISEHSNIGHNSTKSSTVRGGFGRSSFSVSS